jgi:glycosyltransferase involved in cell wall biosynthesis
VLGGAYFPSWKNRLFLGIERQLARGTNRLVVLTQRQAREMHGVLGVAQEEKFRVVSLGLELHRFVSLDRQEARRRMRAALNIPEEALVIGIVGRLVAIKNHPLYLRALAEVCARRTGPVVGLVVGSGDEESGLRGLASSMGLDDVVRWLGWRRDLPDLYGAMDMLALTSHDEGTPVAVLEALAAGAPVVARDVGGVAEVLHAVGAGCVVPEEAEATEWAARLLAQEIEGALPQESRTRVERMFSVERLASDLAAVYREELTRTGR